MALTEDVLNRLYNWKFDTARSYLVRQQELGEVFPTVEEVDTIHALAITFGNSGWFGGSMADVVRAALRSIGISECD